MAKALEDQVFQQLEARPGPADDDIRLEPTQRRVRVMFGGVTIADSRNVMLMLEHRRLAVYYFPAKDVRLDLLVPTSYRSPHSGKGEASFYDVKVGEKVADTAAWHQPAASRPDNGRENITKDDNGNVAKYVRLRSSRNRPAPGRVFLPTVEP